MDALVGQHVRSLVTLENSRRFPLQVGAVGVVTGVTNIGDEATLDINFGYTSCSLSPEEVQVEEKWGRTVPALHDEPRQVSADDDNLWCTIRRSKHLEVHRWNFGHFGQAVCSVLSGGQILDYRIVAMTEEGALEMALSDSMDEIDNCWRCLLTLETLVLEGCPCEVHALSGMVHLAPPAVEAVKWQKWAAHNVPRSACSPQLPMLIPPRIAATVKTLVLCAVQAHQVSSDDPQFPKWMIELVLRGENPYRLLTVAALVSTHWAAAASADELWSVHLRQLHLPSAFRFHACAPVSLGLADHWAILVSGAQGANSAHINGNYVIQDTEHCISRVAQQTSTVPELRARLRELDPFWRDDDDDQIDPYLWPEHLAFTNSSTDLYPESLRLQLIEQLAQLQGAVPRYSKCPRDETEAAQQTAPGPPQSLDLLTAQTEAEEPTEQEEHVRTELVRREDGIWEIRAELEGTYFTVAHSDKKWLRCPSEVSIWIVVVDEIGGLWFPWDDHAEEVQQLKTDLVSVTPMQFTFKDQFSQHCGMGGHGLRGGLPVKQQCRLIQEEKARQTQLRESAQHRPEASDLTEACERMMSDATDSSAWNDRAVRVKDNLKSRTKKCGEIAMYTVIAPVALGVGATTALLLSPLRATGVLSSRRFKQYCINSIVVVAAIPAGAGAGAGGAVGAVGSLAVDTSIALTGAAGHVLQHASEGCKNSTSTTFGQWADEEVSKSNANEGGVLDGLCLGGKGLVCGVADGVTGLIRHPVQGAIEGGGLGFVKGTARGLVGCVTSPVAGGLLLVSETTHGVSNRVHSMANLESCKSTIPLL